MWLILLPSVVVRKGSMFILARPVLTLSTANQT